MLEIYVPQHQYSPNAVQSIASQRLSSSTASAGQQQDSDMVMSSLIQSHSSITSNVNAVLEGGRGLPIRPRKKLADESGGQRVVGNMAERLKRGLEH